MAQTHLVGSMRLDGAEAVYRVVSEQCGDVVKRVPDGETGPRRNWIFSLLPRLKATPGLVELPIKDNGYNTFPMFGVAEGVKPEDVKFEFGYDTDGIAAWPEFKRLKEEGVFGPEVKFQVPIPTSMAIIGKFIQPADRPSLFAPYEARLRTEIENIAKIIPPDELSVQWDVAIEFGLLEHAYGDHDLSDDVIIGEVVRMSTLVPEDIDMGYHLCYGDFASEPGAKGHHFKEPDDAAMLTRVTNAITEEASRTVEFIHMPVPIERDDDAFFVPLTALELRPETELYLGLVHEEDGLEGANRRIATAAKYVTGPFGVATECGMSNEPTERIPALLKLHHDVEVPA